MLTRTPHKKSSVLKYLHIVNRSNRAIKLSIAIDETEVLVTKLGATLASSPGIVHPAGAQYPFFETKVSVRVGARKLSVKELEPAKKKRSFRILWSPDKEDAGFLVSVSKDGIDVSQTYYPAR